MRASSYQSHCPQSRTFDIGDSYMRVALLRGKNDYMLFNMVAIKYVKDLEPSLIVFLLLTRTAITLELRNLKLLFRLMQGLFSWEDLKR